MITTRQMQIARRLHHETKDLSPRATVQIEAAQMQSLLAGLWNEIDRANAAEDRLAGKPVAKRVPYLRILPDSCFEATEPTSPIADA